VVLLALVSGPAASAYSAAFEANRGQAPAGVDYVARGGYTLLLRNSGTEVRLRGGARVETRLVGARAANAEAQEPLDAAATHIRGNRSVKGIPMFSRVRYREVYPGTDVVYYGGATGLEHDFVLGLRRCAWTPMAT
jgi:hypothetical protein